MSVNVLEYNELANEFNTLRNTTLPNAKTATAACALLAGSNCGGLLSLGVNAKMTGYPIRLGCDLQVRPWNCDSWASIPSISVVDGFKVCDVSASEAANQLRCGATCTWTVPAGVTTARFQIWGAGAGSHNMCCCGGGMWGGSGAYASAIVPVTPGSQYIICAGCAQCCWMQSAGPTAGGGSSSWVTGPNLSNFCADGGDPSPYCWLQRAHGRGTASGYCVIMNAQSYCTKVSKGTVYGWCMCSGGGFCWSNTCSGRDSIPFTTSCRMWYGTVSNPTKSCHFVIGAPGMFNAANLAANPGGSNEGCMYLTHPPIVNLTCECCSVYMNSGNTCCGRLGNVQCNVFTWPSRGGYPTSVSGGTDNLGGGYGAAGMVCVQWNKE